ncbi:hypothetical protein [Rhodovastum atsumiense]|uniref:Uncharacterized protein n=1 Tax=Rhodovastum atsumiense TaxID=504468 RepID=A0A5M6IYI4_9PROT|nr:hypothetical protein [Rhodovastum atsumiense]KAA5613406.1 hypothetical protein F1189_04925 [Rhodovastum atsumiense]
MLPFVSPVSGQGLPPQPNPITSPVPAPEIATLHAKITAIDPQTRAIGLAGASGQRVTVTAGSAVDLSQLQVGDIVDAQYYRSVAFEVWPPGVAAPQDEIERVVAREVSAPSGEALQLARISVVVVGIDLAAHSIDVVDPSGGTVRTVVVTNPARIALLSKLKVGETVTAVVSQALAVKVTAAKPAAPIVIWGENNNPETPSGGGR